MERKNWVVKKVERYLWMGRRRWAEAKKAGRVAPTGCFTVYVGPEKERFVIKTEYANHPLFKMLLEDAEVEYGFCSHGPLLLPCHVTLFCKILSEIHAAAHGDDVSYGLLTPITCSPFNPARRLGKTGQMGRGCAAYGLLTPPRLLRN